MDFVNCIQKVGYIGHSDFVNICTGAKTLVKWGQVEWMVFAGMAVVATIITVGIFGMVIETIRANQYLTKLNNSLNKKKKA